jgi:hypothetical protein
MSGLRGLRWFAHKEKDCFMTTSKIKIKLGAIEVEYEGSETFLKEELPQLLSAVSELYSKAHASGAASLSGIGAPHQPVASSSSGTGAAQKPKLEATTGSIAAKLAAKSGPELILAAAARLTFVSQTPTFARQKLIDEMKTASAYYKATYLNNLTSYLNGLVKDGKLNEPSQGNYALTASSLKDLEGRLV